jgi:hypothetical protein
MQINRWEVIPLTGNLKYNINRMTGSFKLHFANEKLCILSHPPVRAPSERYIRTMILYKSFIMLWQQEGSNISKNYRIFSSTMELNVLYSSVNDQLCECITMEVKIKLCLYELGQEIVYLEPRYHVMVDEINLFCVLFNLDVVVCAKPWSICLRCSVTNNKTLFWNTFYSSHLINIMQSL